MTVPIVPALRDSLYSLFFIVPNNLQGTKFEVGDVVSVLDEEGGSYYALVRGFLQDQYAEKYAVITWLLPRYPNPTHFDPTQFILGKLRYSCKQ